MTFEARVLIIGAGLTGLAVAAGLRQAGADPVVLDKSRGLGGRLATRRAGDLRFDHGAQYLRPRGPAFAAFLDTLKPSGALAVWPGVEGDAPAYVGQPGMSALVRPLAQGVTVHCGVPVAAARHAAGQWHLTDAAGALLARAAVLVVAIPAPQAARLLEGNALAARIGAVDMDPCWTLMAGFAARPDLPDTGRAPGAALPWIARDGGKPWRGTETWVAQASAGWTRAALDLPKAEAAAALLSLMRDRAGGRLPPVTHLDAHRWLYAQAPVPLGLGCLSDPGTGLVVAGDWCLGDRAEHAVLSAQAALAAAAPMAAAAAAG